ncbi:MAG: lipase family protein [Nibricoccus sp.]
MKLKTLTPQHAVQVAVAIYDNRLSDNVSAAFEKTAVDEHFDFSNQPPSSLGAAQRFTARTGAFEFKSKTGFAVMAMGKKGKDHEGEALLACRGTVSGYDWLSDGNYAMTLGASGTRVHSGFNRAFNDMKAGFASFLTRNGPTRIHCIGHSLGGALATLAADWLATMGYKVVLYTFGSPRVGTEDFAQNLTQRLGQKGIHRVCHSGDPVTMVPVWPYMHAPRPDGECWISRSAGLSMSAHFKANYAQSVAQGPNWSDLRFPTPTMALEYGVRLASPESLLQMLTVSPLIVFGAVVRMICKPLAIVLMPGVSVLDQMSLWVEKACSISIESDNLARTLLNALIKFLGLTITVPQQILHDTIRLVWGYFLSTYYKLAGQAAAAADSQA